MTRMEVFIKRAAKLHKEYMKHSAKCKSLHRAAEIARGRARSALRNIVKKQLLPSGTWTRIAEGTLQQVVKSVPKPVMTYLKSLQLDRSPADYAEIKFEIDPDITLHGLHFSIRKCDDGYSYVLYYGYVEDEMAVIKALKMKVDNSVEVAKLRAEETQLKSRASATRSRLITVRREIAELEGEQDES